MLTVVAPSSGHSYKEMTDEDDCQRAGIDRSSEMERPKVISLAVRCHGGKEAQKPFEIRPSQFVSCTISEMKFNYVLMLTGFLMYLVCSLTLVSF